MTIALDPGKWTADIRPENTEWLRAGSRGRPVEVDREALVIRGYVVAQEGKFKSEGRGEFDRDSLRAIVRLMQAAPNGLKSRFAHPGLSDDGIGKFLGRARNPRIDAVTRRESDGELRTDEVAAVRADLHLDPTSHTTPGGDLGGYVMDLAESDPDALSSSLVLTAEKEYRIDKTGRPAVDEDGNELPPLWRPIRLHASDVVDTGDAVDGLLSIEGNRLPDAAVRQATAILDRLWPDQTREEIERRCVAYLRRYLEWRFGADQPPPPRPRCNPEIERRRLRLKRDRAAR